MTARADRPRARRTRGGRRPGRQEVRHHQPGRATSPRPLDGPAHRRDRHRGRGRRRRRRRRGPGARTDAAGRAGGHRHRVPVRQGRARAASALARSRRPAVRCRHAAVRRSAVPTSSPASSCSSICPTTCRPWRSWPASRRGRCVVSVPWEPWFRLGNLGRGKNVRRLGNDPEHVQFFTPGRLRRALGAGFREVTVTPAFPWLIAEARNPR